MTQEKQNASSGASLQGEKLTHYSLGQAKINSREEGACEQADAIQTVERAGKALQEEKTKSQQGVEHVHFALKGAS